MYIKSSTLLPSASETLERDNQEEEDDPRLELIRKLEEYQKYKEVSARAFAKKNR